MYLELQDIVFTPHNDAGADDTDVLQEHQNLINNNQYSDATNYLDNKNYQNGFRASLFNSLEEKIKKMQVYLLNKFGDPEIYYSITEPTREDMVGKIFWMQLY